MNYAKIELGVVTNVISLKRDQEDEFKGYIEIGKLPVNIGDTYQDGLFYRNGKQVKTDTQRMDEKLQATSVSALSAAKEICKAHNEPPMADVGIFVLGANPWEAGKTYARYDLFQYRGVVGWVKQAHTSQETWLPFATGTEALYGARPAPDEEGIYPYVYNMAANVGMKVREGDKVYVCIQAIDDMLWPPSQIAAHFNLME